MPYIYTNRYIDTQINEYVGMSTDVYIFLFIRIYTYIYICIYMYFLADTFSTHIYIYTCIHMLFLANTYIHMERSGHEPGRLGALEQHRLSPRADAKEDEELRLGHRGGFLRIMGADCKKRAVV